jgi:hypothetical protein
MAPPSTPAPTTVRFGQDATEWLAELAQLRATGLGIGATAANAVSMLIDISAAELRRIPLTVGQASLLAEAGGGWLLGDGVGTMLAYELEDLLANESGPALPWSVAGSFEEKHGLPPGGGLELAGWLRGVGPAADFALRLALARWWHRGLEASADGFRAAGLRIVDPAPAAAG